MNLALKGILAGVSVWSLLGCTGSEPPEDPPVVAKCEDGTVAGKIGAGNATKHTAKRLTGASVSCIEGIKLMPRSEISAFLGGKDFKITFVRKKKLYLLTYENENPTITILSHADENPYGSAGTINSPLFSPDGKKIVFAGLLGGSVITSFVREAVPGATEGWRVPLDSTASLLQSEPHWYIDEAGKSWVYYATKAGTIQYSGDSIAGSTMRIEVKDDWTVGQPEPTSIKGAYKGGISRDGKWAGTSYATSALFNMENKHTIFIGEKKQQCNPSINPFPKGSLHTDYLMILAFGGQNPIVTLYDSTILEGLHENLWIYNQGNKVVWRAKRPDESKYVKWEKPEWSTHPMYATGIGIYRSGDNVGDLYIIKMGDLANLDEAVLTSQRKLAEAEGFIKVGEGFGSSDWSHLWVAE